MDEIIDYKRCCDAKRQSRHPRSLGSFQLKVYMAKKAIKSTPKAASNRSLFKLLEQNTKLLKELHKAAPKAEASRRSGSRKSAKKGARPVAARATQSSFSEDEVWEILRTDIIPEPPVGKATPMEAVLLRISVGLLGQRINGRFFSSPHDGGAVSRTALNDCDTAGQVWLLICNHLAQQGRLE